MSRKVVTLFLYRKKGYLEPIIKAILEYNPDQFYIIIDQANDEVIKLIQKEILEQTQILANDKNTVIIRPEKHLGISKIYQYGLGEVFEKEDSTIILEDDTIPASPFFQYCEIMLERFKQSPDIYCINGCNLGLNMQKDTFFKARLSLPFWGWATWKEKWSKMPSDYSFWEKYRASNHPVEDFELEYFREIFDRFVQKDKSWDVKWCMFLLSQSYKTILPGINLVENKGFTEEATFTNIPHSKFGQLRSLKSIQIQEFKIEVEAEKEYLKKVKSLIKDMALRPE